jgi:MerR family transcriptional regulator, light-induced transcriptional regulator
MTSSDGWLTGCAPDLLDVGTADTYGTPRSANGSARGTGARNNHLLQTIEGEIIPRLVLARRATGDVPAPTAPAGWTPGHELIAEIADLVARKDVGAAATRIDALRQSGLTVETLYLELLAPAARYLGELWEADIVDFTTVTLGCTRLQQLLHELSPSFFREAEQHEHRRRVLLVPVPGEQHTFGLYMVAEFFRRAGWDVWSGCMPIRELTELVGKEAFSLVGFSLSGDQRLDALASNIRSVRRASRNRGIGVLVGGPVFVGHPELVSLVGADATAQDGRQATHQAQNTLSLLSRAS